MNDMQNTEISVIDPISDAFNRVKIILFSPFDLKKWFVIGFCAWLANLTKGSGSSGSGGGGGHEEFKNIIINNLPTVIIVGSLIFLLILAISIVLTWLSSRGKFMFLDNVVKNEAQVKAPWRKYCQQGNNLFIFVLIAGLILFMCIAFLIGISIASVVLIEKASGQIGVLGISTILCSVIIFIPLLIIGILIFKLTDDFVVLIMYIKGSSCMEAWREFLGLLRVNKWNFTLYILFQILIAIVIGTITFTLCCATCCIAGCIMVIPYIGTVFLLPILIFSRSYSLYYFAQYGDVYNVFMPSGRSEGQDVIPPELQQ